MENIINWLLSPFNFYRCYLCGPSDQPKKGTQKKLAVTWFLMCTSDQRFLVLALTSFSQVSDQRTGLIMDFSKPPGLFEAAMAGDKRIKSIDSENANTEFRLSRCNSFFKYLTTWT